jgi:membrane protein DedA with SNARE-associated domain
MHVAGSTVMLATAHAASIASAALSDLNRVWAYVTLAVTGIITEEATPLVGGLAAHDGRLNLIWVAWWTAAGSWVADILLYYLGRWRGHWVRKRWRRVRNFILRALKIVRRHPWRSSLAVRFAYGLRLTLPIACGAARIPILIYLIGSAISAAVWSFLFTLLGWAFGRGALIVLGHVHRYERFLILTIIVGIGLVFWVMRTRHVEEEVVEVLAAGDPVPPPVESGST